MIENHEDFKQVFYGNSWELEEIIEEKIETNLEHRFVNGNLAILRRNE